MSRVERMFGPRESWGKGNGTPSVSEADSSPIPCGTGEPLEGREEKRAGIRGFVSIKCPRCRFKARYLTNREEKLIQMECLNCSHPVNFRKGFRRGNYVVEVERI